RVNDVFDDENMLVSKIDVEVFTNLHDTAGPGACTVRRDGHPVHRDVLRKRTHEISHDHDRTLEHAHEHELFAVIILRNLLAEFSQASINLLLSHKNGGQVLCNICRT